MIQHVIRFRRNYLESMGLKCLGWFMFGAERFVIGYSLAENRLGRLGFSSRYHGVNFTLLITT